MMKNVYLFLLLFSISCYSFAQENLFTVQDGDWDDPATWSILADSPLNPDGLTPSTVDNIFIRHSITHDIGAFQSYVHLGNIRIERNSSQVGVYEIITSSDRTDPFFFGGKLMEVFGELRSSSDFEHQLPQLPTMDAPNDGILIFYEEALVDIGDDFILNGEARTEFRNVECGDGFTFDDLYIKGRGNGLFICGSGRFKVPHQIRVWDIDNPNTELTNSVQNGTQPPPMSAAAEAELNSQLCENFALFEFNTGTCETCDLTNSCCQDANYCCVGSGCAPPTSLPVELTHFGAEIIKDAVKLSWVTGSEVQNDHFMLEKADAYGDFESLARLPGNGTTSTASYYEYFDVSPNTGRNLYRLKQVDIDGAFSYSNIIAASFQIDKPAIAIFPHPVQDKSQIDVVGFPVNQKVSIRVENLLGQILMEEWVEVDRNGAASLTIDNKLGSGTYLIKAHSQAVHLSRKFLIY